MSSMLKRELEMEFAEMERRESGFSSKKKKNSKLVDKLPSNRHGIKKQMKRLKEQNSRPKFGAPSTKKLKFSFLELHSKQNIAERDQATVESGVQKLLGLSKASRASSDKVSSAKAVVDHNERTKRHYVPKSREFLEKFSKKKKPETDSNGTVFTEEDFEKFSREYFVNSKPLHPTTLTTKSKFTD